MSLDPHIGVVVGQSFSSLAELQECIKSTARTQGYVMKRYTSNANTLKETGYCEARYQKEKKNITCPGGYLALKDAETGIWTVCTAKDHCPACTQHRKIMLSKSTSANRKTPAPAKSRNVFHVSDDEDFDVQPASKKRFASSVTLKADTSGVTNGTDRVRASTAADPQDSDYVLPKIKLRLNSITPPHEEAPTSAPTPTIAIFDEAGLEIPEAKAGRVRRACVRSVSASYNTLITSRKTKTKTTTKAPIKPKPRAPRKSRIQIKSPEPTSVAALAPVVALAPLRIRAGTTSSTAPSLTSASTPTSAGTPISATPRSSFMLSEVIGIRRSSFSGTDPKTGVDRVGAWLIKNKMTAEQVGYDVMHGFNGVYYVKRKMGRRAQVTSLNPADHFPEYFKHDGTTYGKRKRGHSAMHEGASKPATLRRSSY